MFATQKNRIKDLTKEQYAILQSLCRYSKNLYNVALYNTRQHYFKTGKLLSCAKNCALCIKDNYLRLPLSRSTKRDTPDARSIRFPFPDRIDTKSVREVRINPAHNARFFEVEIVYREKPVALPSLDRDRIMGIDTGVDNLAACAATTGTVFLIDGKRLKAANQWYNKEKARLQSIKDLHKIPGETNRMATLAFNRENFTTDYMRKAARYIVDCCIKDQIGTLAVGVNTGQKQEINIGHVNNLNFVQIHIWKLRRILRDLCRKYGIFFVETEESYTSRASFLDRDFLPVYNPEDPINYRFSGRRVTRGLYRSGKGIINADLNGAANFIKRSFLLARSNHGSLKRTSMSFVIKMAFWRN